MMHTFENDGPILQRTNYFDSAAAAKGEFYLTTNAGCLRLLVPDSQQALLPEMRCQKVQVYFLKNPERIEMMFDDKSNNPFRLTLAIEQCDATLKAGLYTFSVYVRLGEKYQFACEVKTEHGNTGKKNASKGGLTSTIQMRCAQSDKALWVKAAQKEDQKLSEWITASLNKTLNIKAGEK